MDAIITRVALQEKYSMSITFAQFSKYPDLTYGFSTRSDGSMHRRLEKANRERYFREIGIDPRRVVTADLAHGTKVAVVSDEAAGNMIGETDALITDTKNLFISVTGADCFPLYFYDPAHKAIGIAHVGWRGLVSGVVPNVVGKMMQSFETEPSVLVVGIGPGIRQCHFDVSPENRALYERYSVCVAEREGKTFVNIPGIIKIQLEQSGVNKEYIQDSESCTYCQEQKYFSFRRDKPKDIQSMAAYIGLT